jgi:N-acetyltransferase
MDPPMQPVLADDLVQLRPLVAGDWGALFAVASDPEIWAIHPAHDRWQEPVFRAYFDEALASKGGLTVRDAATGIVIGGSRFDRDHAEDGEIEIGWTFLARSHWGGAYNRSMKRLMLGHAFAQGYKAVIFLVGETNMRSRRALEKIGGVLTDRRYTLVRSGKPIDHVIYAVTAESFATGPLALA